MRGRPGWRMVATISVVGIGVASVLGATGAAATGTQFPAYGMLDCNGHSPIQHPLKVGGGICAEVHVGGAEGRIEDNGHYIGHDEPLIQFFSSATGSGNTTTWTETLPHDPAAAPTTGSPLHDVTHSFELSITHWYSMDLCDPNSFPQLPCTPNSDRNAPSGRYPGAGNAFLEVQFYPPGFAPFADSISCDNTHWCAALTIDSLECTTNLSCNPNCFEPINFAWIADNGVPTGPPSPQNATLATFTPNAHTLLMNPGDLLRTEVFDNKHVHALEVRVSDLTTGKSGFMIASGANGYENTSIGDCSGTPFNYEPEYSTASPKNDGSWAVANINSAIEIGHFTPCTSLEHKQTMSFGSVSDFAYTECIGPYESATTPDTSPSAGEPGLDFPCFPKGDKHGALATPPNEASGCIDTDLDYDGAPYWRDWPDSATPDQFPSPILKYQPATAGGAAYPRMEFLTDSPSANPNCSDATLTTECVVPEPQAPGAFYPYWTFAKTPGGCAWEFGQMTNGNTFGGDAQWGKPAIYLNNFIQDAGPIMPNPTTC